MSEDSFASAAPEEPASELAAAQATIAQLKRDAALELLLAQKDNEILRLQFREQMRDAKEERDHEGMQITTMYSNQKVTGCVRITDTRYKTSFVS